LRDRARDLRAPAGLIILLLPLAIILLSVALSPASNWTVRVALAAFCALAIVRPDAAFLVTIALGGFGTLLSHLGGMPMLRVTEVLVVGSIAGFGVRALPRGSSFHRALTGNVSAVVVLFAMTVIASTVVWLRVYQIQTTYPFDYVQTFFRFLTRDYFVEPGNFAVLVTAATILEGLALYVVSAALCRADPTFFDRALRMLAVGGAGLAMMSVVRLSEIILRSPGALDAMRASSAGLRISPQIGDYIAAGSYFAICWLATLGMAIEARRGRLLWMAAGAPGLVALYLTGSRSVIGATLIGLVALAIIILRQRIAAARGFVIVAILVIVTMVVTYQKTIGRDVAGRMAMQSLTVRFELMRAGLQVIETRPMFGVGLDRFFLVAGGFASPELRALWEGRMNPHNDFLRFGGELGVIGLALFVWILVDAGRRIGAVFGSTSDARFAGIAGGLIAFLVTSLVSNPLMVRDVSYVFWIALGLAAGYSSHLRTRGRAESLGVPQRRTRRRLAQTAALVLGTVLVFSIPFRAQQELAATDLTHVTYGLFEWGKEGDGTASRWTGPRARFFVDGRARRLEIPAIGATPSGVVQTVEVSVDGRIANRFAVGSEWQRLSTVLPHDESTIPRRIDLVVSPSWVPAEMIAGNHDRRVLGVKVGVVKVVMASDPGR
jgi:O-antigen ligase